MTGGGLASRRARSRSKPAKAADPARLPSRAARELSGRVRTLLQDTSARALARRLGVSDSTVRRWRDERVDRVANRNTARKLERAYTREVADIRREARRGKVRLPRGLEIKPKVRRIQRPAYELLKQPIPGKPGKFYTKKTLPKVATGTVEYDVSRMDRGEIMRLIAWIRDRGGKFRVIYKVSVRAYGGEEKLKYKRRMDLRGKTIRTSTAPEDPEDWTDADILDYLETNVYKTQFHKPVYLMENE